MNQRHRQDYPLESALDARIRNYELRADAIGAGDVLDLSKETEATRKLYGLDNPTRRLRARLLMAGGWSKAAFASYVFRRQSLGQPRRREERDREDRGETDCRRRSFAISARGLLDSTIVL
jgi:hypothetical protein